MTGPGEGHRLDFPPVVPIPVSDIADVEVNGERFAWISDTARRVLLGRFHRLAKET